MNRDIAYDVACRTCKAKRRRPCVRIMGAAKGTTLPAPHYGRVLDAQRAARSRQPRFFVAKHGQHPDKATAIALEDLDARTREGFPLVVWGPSVSAFGEVWALAPSASIAEKVRRALEEAYGRGAA